MLPLKEKKFIITGAATGMGAATAIAYARAGAQVVAWYRNRTPDAAFDTLSDEERARIAFARHDVADKADVDEGVAEAVRTMGGLDGLVNAAGIAPSSPAASISLDAYEEVMAINVRGTILTNQAVFPHLKERGGRILNFASATGVTGYPGKAHYATSKGAVLAWMRSIAREWAPFRITVNAIAPAIWTPMYDKTRSEMTPEQLARHDAQMAVNVPLGGKLGDAEKDFAPMMVFLAGDGAGFLTGQTYCIDGGILMLS